MKFNYRALSGLAIEIQELWLQLNELSDDKDADLTPIVHDLRAIAQVLEIDERGKLSMYGRLYLRPPSDSITTDDESDDEDES